ncbi:hypothetical protein [Haloarcula amylovorans]|uniref:hypothetical protein n=1 Tax=Haloarcula amylovorans TaxID=2562280 RepID=UPI0010769209|nr:hypothetical protein [Halomicroarcula amylolytica]
MNDGDKRVGTTAFPRSTKAIAKDVRDAADFEIDRTQLLPDIGAAVLLFSAATTLLGAPVVLFETLLNGVPAALTAYYDTLSYFLATFSGGVVAATAAYTLLLTRLMPLGRACVIGFFVISFANGLLTGGDWFMSAVIGLTAIAVATLYELTTRVENVHADAIPKTPVATDGGEPDDE